MIKSSFSKLLWFVKIVVIGNLISFKDYIIREIRIVLIRAKIRKVDLSLSFDRILILAPHPDDEVFGCAGLIQQLIAQGKDVKIIFLTSGESSHKDCCKSSPEVIKKIRQSLAFTANSLLNVSSKNLLFLNFNDGKISFQSDQAMKLNDIIREMSPSAIFVPHLGDLHQDHITTQQMGVKFAPPKCVVYEYCVWFWYNNVWHIDWGREFYIKMTKEQYKIKERAIDVYIKPLAPCGHPWSGILPSFFLNAIHWKYEIFFRIK